MGPHHGGGGEGWCSLFFALNSSVTVSWWAEALALKPRRIQALGVVLVLKQASWTLVETVMGQYSGFSGKRLLCICAAI